MDEHDDDCCIPESRPREQREGIGMIEQHVAEGPIHCSCRRKGESQHIERGKQVHELELLRLPHGVHDLSATKVLLSEEAKHIESVDHIDRRVAVSHCDSMASKSVEDVGSACEVQYQLGWA